MLFESGESEIKVPADTGSSEGPLPGMQMAVFPLYPHMVVNREQEQTLVSLPITSLIHEGFIFMT